MTTTILATAWRVAAGVALLGLAAETARAGLALLTPSWPVLSRGAEALARWAGVW